MATTDHNSVGAGKTPKLGADNIEGISRPGTRGGQQAKGRAEAGSVTETRPGGKGSGTNTAAPRGGSEYQTARWDVPGTKGR